MAVSCIDWMAPSATRGSCHPDEHRESVKDSDGREVTGKNGAAYNFESEGVGHVVSDVVPWILVGTGSRGDDSTTPERAGAAAVGFIESGLAVKLKTTPISCGAITAPGVGTAPRC